MTLLAPNYLENYSYDPISDRQIMAFLSAASTVGPGVSGVLNTTDYACSAGSGLTSSVSAGAAIVMNTFTTLGGGYIVRNNGPIASPAHAAGHATLPRIDQLLLKVNDAIDGGDASSGLPNVIVVPGTPTSGATLANRNGAGSIAGYANAMRMYYVLVPAAASAASSFSYLRAMPRLAADFGSVRARSTAFQDPAAGAAIIFDTEDYDPDSCYNNATGLWTCPAKGIWQIESYVVGSVTSGVLGNTYTIGARWNNGAGAGLEMYGLNDLYQWTGSYTPGSNLALKFCGQTAVIAFGDTVDITRFYSGIPAHGIGGAKLQISLHRLMP